MATLFDFRRTNPPKEDYSWRIYVDQALFAISKSINALNDAVGREYTVSQLPTNAQKGWQAVVTDGQPGLAWGATVTGGGSTKYLVWFNGSNWTVLGK